MGSKFANINVKGSDLEAVREVLPDFTPKNVSGGWITAMSGELSWGETQGSAKKASRVLPCPILSTEYFDDDYVEFTVFLAGKRAARFVPAAYEGFPRVPGKPAAWREALGLSAEDEKTLKTVFRETSPETCVRLLEDVLGCPLWAEEEFANQLRAPNGDFLRAYLARKDAESKIVNKTRLQLLDELPCSRAVARRGRSALTWRDGLNGPAVFYQVRDGRLCQLFDVPPAISDRIPFPIPPEGGPDVLFPVYVQRPEGETVYTLDREGRLLDEVFLPGMTEKQCLSIDSEHILAGGLCRNVRTRENQWDMGIRDTSYGLLAPLSFPDGRLCWCYDVTERRELMTTEGFLLTAADGTDRREVRLASVYHWQRPVLWGNKLLLGVERELICFDSALRPLWSMELGRNVYQSGQAAVDGDTLYMSVSYDSLTAIDLAEHRVTASRELGDSEAVLLAGVLPGLGPVVTSGGSSLQVWDRELRLVSRHRTRGE